MWKWNYFVMDHRIFKIPVLGWFFKLVKAIPIASRSEDPVLYEAAFEAAAKVLRDGVDAPVIPMALTNMWGSYFSRIEKGNAMTKPFRRGVFSRGGLNVGTALAPDQVQPGVLQARVATL